MLANYFVINYRHPEKTPIQLKIDGNRLDIDCCFNYNRRALQVSQQTGCALADRIEKGIIDHWSGSYRLELPGLNDLVTVTVKISRQNERRSVPIRIRRLMLMPAHVSSPFYRRLWGIFKTGQIESLGTNWSLQQPGRMILPVEPINWPRTVNWPWPASWPWEAVAAHEAGHLFGLGDAYAAIYRFYYAAPGTEYFMMHSNQTVQPAEIIMLLNAHASGRMQFFPRKWQLRRFGHGLGTDIRQRTLHLWHRLQVTINAHRRAGTKRK
jgi:hypothetical protein